MKYLALVLSFSISGCATAYHVRETIDPVKGTVVAREKEGMRSFIMKGAVDKFRTSTSDGNNYKHTTTASGITGSGDADLVNALIQAGATAAATGAKAIVK